MGRNWFDALCKSCKREIRVLTGNPLLCPDCLMGRGDEKVYLNEISTTGRDKKFEDKE